MLRRLHREYSFVFILCSAPCCASRRARGRSGATGTGRERRDGWHSRPAPDFAGVGPGLGKTLIHEHGRRVGAVGEHDIGQRATVDVVRPELIDAVALPHQRRQPVPRRARPRPLRPELGCRGTGFRSQVTRDDFPPSNTRNITQKIQSRNAMPSSRPDRD